MSNEQINYEHLLLKIKLRKYLLGLPNRRHYRSMVRVNFMRAPDELFDAVLNECVAEGLISLSKGEREAEFLTWCDEGSIHE